MGKICYNPQMLAYYFAVRLREDINRSSMCDIYDGTDVIYDSTCDIRDSIYDAYDIAYDICDITYERDDTTMFDIYVCNSCNRSKISLVSSRSLTVIPADTPDNWFDHE